MQNKTRKKKGEKKDGKKGILDFFNAMSLQEIGDHASPHIPWDSMIFGKKIWDLVPLIFLNEDVIIIK